MYRVYIQVEPDKDFSYDNSILGFDKSVGEIDLYFDSRHKVTEVIKGFCKTFINTIDGKEYIKDEVEQIKHDLSILSLLVGKFEYFGADLEYGNQFVKVWIVPGELKSLKMYDSDNIIKVYECGEPRYGVCELLDNSFFRNVDMDLLLASSDLQ